MMMMIIIRLVLVVLFFLGVFWRLNFICRRFGTLCQFHLYSRCKYYTGYEDGTHSVPKRRNVKFRRRGITQQKEHKIENTAKA